MTESVLDLLLPVALLGLGWRSLREPDLFTAVVLFIILGLLLSLTWVRLGAPDIALAEAAIGAGLTGALLLDAVAQMAPPDAGGGRTPIGADRGARAVGVVAALALAPFAALLMLWLPAAARVEAGLRAAVDERLAVAGASHPVTAVLLNFRAYDTWLEVGVLLLAVVAAVALRGGAPIDVEPGVHERPVLGWVVRLFAPLMALVAGVLLWFGTHAPGGAFQAAAVLASGGMVLVLAGIVVTVPLRGRRVWAILCAGFTAFLVVAIVSAVGTGLLLAFPPRMAPILIPVVEVFVTVSIAATLVLLFFAARPPAPSPARDASDPGIERTRRPA